MAGHRIHSSNPTTQRGNKMFTVKVKGQEFQATEEVAMNEWMKGANVYNASGDKVEGVDSGATGDYFIY